jgi:hypothetical protein
MSARFSKPKGKRAEQGYALMLVVFLTSLLLLATIVAAPSVRTERKREQEEEMIWRGKQYVRAIKLYYRKNGKFPTALDDLTKPKTGSLRYLRQAYKDPMNKEDGSWRLIYVGPAGQLIGSLKPPQTLQLQGGSQPGTPVSAMGASTNSSQSAFGNSGNSQSSFGSQGGSSFGSQGASSFGSQGNGLNGGAAPGADGAAQGGLSGANGSQPMSSPTGLSSDTSSIIGGNIIGIGSKIDRKSVIVYEKATNYHLFEFVWDPSKDAMGIGGTPGTQIGTPAGQGQTPGQGFGQGFGSSFGQSGQNPSGMQPSQPGGGPGNPTPDQPPLSPSAPPQRP